MYHNGRDRGDIAAFFAEQHRRGSAETDAEDVHLTAYFTKMNSISTNLLLFLSSKCGVSVLNSSHGPGYKGRLVEIGATDH